MLSLPEQLTLLSWDERGRNQIIVGTVFNACLAGAALVELAWAGVVNVKPTQVSLPAPGATGRPILDAVAATIAAAEPLPPAQWTRLSRSPLPGLRDLARQGLAGQGAFVQRPVRRFLLFPGSALVPEAQSREAVVAQAHAALLGPPPQELRQQVLGVLVDLSGLIYRLTSAAELPQAKERARTLEAALMGDEADEPVRLLLQGVYAAREAWNSSGP